MRRWVLMVLLVVPGFLQAQEFAFQHWHEGKIVLEGGDTLRGNVMYNLQTDLVQLQVDKRLETLTARKVLSFEIFDKTVGRYRSFFSLPYSATGSYKATGVL